MKFRNMIETLFILFLLFSYKICLCQNPCNDSHYQYLINKNINDLTQLDIQYIHKIDSECAEYLLPNFKDENRWKFISTFVDRNLYYDENTIILDTILTVWIKEVRNDINDVTYIKYSFNLNSKLQKSICEIWYYNNNMSTFIDKDELFNSYDYSNSLISTIGQKMEELYNNYLNHKN